MNEEQELQTDQPQPDAPLETAVVVPAPEPDEPDAIEVRAGEKYVPVSALQSVREEVKALKAYKEQAERVPQLEAELNRVRPYAEFLDKHPNLLNPPPAPPSAPMATADDPHLVAYAKRFDLYTPDGKPDTDRAKLISDDNRQMAREEAARAIQPLEQQHLTQRAEQNMQWIAAQKDAHGQPLSTESIRDAVAPIVQGISEDKVLKMLADPHVTQLLLRQAKAIQFERTKAPPVAPTTGPLHVESQGGGTSYAMSEDERSLARIAGRSEKSWTESSKRFVPGKANRLE